MAVIFDKVRAAAALDDLLENINDTGGPTAGAIDLYTGSAPGSVAVGATGTHLAHCPFSTPANNAFGSANTSTEVATADTTAGWVAQDTSPAASGTIGYWRIVDHAGTAVAQGTVGGTGSGADIEFNSLSVTAGVLVRIVSLTMHITGIY